VIVSNTVKGNLIKIAGLIVVGLVLYWGWGYYRIERYTSEKETYIVKPKVYEGCISEIGYIMEVRKINDLWEGKRTIVWFVKIPKTNKIYSCYWDGGFADFAKDDAVRLIHYNGTEDNADYSGYIIGMHENIKGKSALVNAVDVEELDYDYYSG
jgi:hypothetical protein